jgi:hypothetical protein
VPTRGGAIYFSPEARYGSVRRKSDGMKLNLLTVVGVLVIGLGIAALVHRQIVMPASKQEVEIDNRKVIIETRRVIAIPPVLGGLIILCGAGLVLQGARRK